MRAGLGASIAYLAVLLALFWRLLLGNCLSSGAKTWLSPPFDASKVVAAAPYVNVWTNDFVEQFSAFQQYQYESAKQRRFPTWNPHIFLGQPFHANGQSALLFPTNWIYFLLDPDLVRGPIAILRLWISAIAVFRLLLRNTLSPTPAFVGGAVWMLSSFNIHWLLWPQSNATLWTPVILLALDHLLVTPTVRNYALTALAAAPLFLAGHPGVEYLCCYLIAIYSAARILLVPDRSRRQIFAAALIAMAALATGFIAASAAWLPLLIQIRQAHEYLDINAHRVSTTDLPMSALWLFLLPEFFGRSRGAYPGFEYNGPDNYVEMTLWFGAIACLLALAVMLKSTLTQSGRSMLHRSHPQGFLLIFGIIAFCFSMLVGFKVWPVYQLVQTVPGSQLTKLRRMFLVTDFSGAVLTACALQQILIRKDRIVMFFSALLSLAASLIVIATVHSRWSDTQQIWQHSLRQTQDAYGLGWQVLKPDMVQQFGGFRMVAGIVPLSLGTLLLLYIYRQRVISPRTGYCLAVVITVDLMLPTYDFNPIAPKSLVAPPPPVVVQTTIQQTGDGRMIGADWLLDPNISMTYGFRDTRGYDFPHSDRLAKLFQVLRMDGKDNRGLIDSNRLNTPIDPQLQAYLNRTCVRNMVLADKVLNNPGAYPRAYLARSASAVANQEDALQALLDPTIDLRDRSVYEGPSRPIPAAKESSPEIATIKKDDPEHVLIECNTTADRLLVLSDRMDDGWEASIDGKPVEPVTANYLFRGVFVPAGRHFVEWNYRAPGLFPGIVLSISTLVLLTILVCFRRRSKN